MKKSTVFVDKTTLETSEVRPTWRYSSADYFCYGGGPAKLHSKKSEDSWKLHSKTSEDSWKLHSKKSEVLSQKHRLLVKGC